MHQKHFSPELHCEICNLPFYGDLRVFREWIYSNQLLEQELIPDDYLDLVSTDYNEKNSIPNDAEIVFENAREILRPYLNNQEFETSQLTNLLYDLKRGVKQVAVNELWRLMEKGYFFLAPLLNDLSSPANKTRFSVSSESNLMDVNGFEDHVDEFIREVIGWLDNSLIVLTGKSKSDFYPSCFPFGFWTYLDLRSSKQRPICYATDEAFCRLPEYFNHYDLCLDKVGEAFFEDHLLFSKIGDWLVDLYRADSVDHKLVGKICSFLNYVRQQDYPCSWWSFREELLFLLDQVRYHKLDDLVQRITAMVVP